MTDVWDMRLGLVRLLDALTDPDPGQDRDPEILEVESLLVQASNRMRYTTAHLDLVPLAQS